MKKMILNVKEKATAGIAAAIGIAASPMSGLAAGEFDVVNRANQFILNIVTGIGIAFIAFGVISLAISFQSHDDAQRSRAVMSIIGGSIAVSVTAVLNALGVSTTV